MPSPACAAIRGPPDTPMSTPQCTHEHLGIQSTGSQNPSPPTCHLCSHANWLWLPVATANHSVLMLLLQETWHEETGSADFLICSSVLDLGKIKEIHQVPWTETDTLVNKSLPSASPSAVSPSYTFTAVLIELQLSPYNPKKETVLNPEVTITKLIETWQICQNMHQDKHPFLICRSNATAGLSVCCCDSPEVHVVVKTD